MADTTRTLLGNRHDEPSSPRTALFFSCNLDYRTGGSLLESIPGSLLESAEVTNGDLAKVRSVDGGCIQLEDGRTLPANYHEFDHGYAVTAHRSQGKTVDAVVLSGDGMKQEQFYVAASRGRSEIAIVTSDREQLRESLGISSARPSAMELAKEQAHALGLEHGIQQAPVKNINLPVRSQEIAIALELGIGL